MTLACEGSATQALDATRCGSFDCARRLASLRMTLHSRVGFKTFEIHYFLRNPLLDVECDFKESAYGVFGSVDPDPEPEPDPEPRALELSGASRPFLALSSDSWRSTSVSCSISWKR